MISRPGIRFSHEIWIAPAVSGTAVKELRRRGYDARALVGGITAWHAIGGATVAMDTSTYEGAS
jgi:hypothetical protein